MATKFPSRVLEAMNYECRLGEINDNIRYFRYILEIFPSMYYKLNHTHEIVKINDEFRLAAH